MEKIVTNRGKPGLLYDGFQYIIHREAKSSRTWRCTKKVKEDFIISHLEGAAREKLQYRSSTEKKTSEAVLGTSREGFGERSTISDSYQIFINVGRTTDKPTRLSW